MDLFHGVCKYMQTTNQMSARHYWWEKVLCCAPGSLVSHLQLGLWIAIWLPFYHRSRNMRGFQEVALNFQLHIPSLTSTLIHCLSLSKESACNWCTNPYFFSPPQFNFLLFLSHFLLCHPRKNVVSSPFLLLHRMPTKHLCRGLVVWQKQSSM